MPDAAPSSLFYNIELITAPKNLNFIAGFNAHSRHPAAGKVICLFALTLGIEHLADLYLINSGKDNLKISKPQY